MYTCIVSNIDSTGARFSIVYCDLRNFVNGPTHLLEKANCVLFLFLISYFCDRGCAISTTEDEILSRERKVVS